MNIIIEYIKNNCWCDFKNNNRTLFYRSIYNNGIIKYKNKIIENDVTETLTIYYPNNSRQIHAFNGEQSPLNNKTLQNLKPKDLNKFIKRYNKIREKIEIFSKSIEKEGDFLNSKKIKRIIELESRIYSYEYLISNLANKTVMDSYTYTNFIKWKNNPNNKEPWIYNKIFEVLLKLHKIDISISQFKQYIHFQELLDILDNKKDIHIIVDKIIIRKEKGFLLLNFHNQKYFNKIITNISVLKETIKFLEEIEDNRLKNSDQIEGKPTFPFNILEGECIILTKDNFNNEEIFNKIVVCSVLTVQDTIKLMDCRCILVEYGGYLSHASIWSREYNKPCLIGCKGILKFLHTGDNIKIDGKTGTIKKTTH